LHTPCARPLQRGVALRWPPDEPEFLGVPFEGRGRRGDEAIRLMRALWNGERDFHGQLWSVHDATAAPHPARALESVRGGTANATLTGSSGRSTTPPQSRIPLHDRRSGSAAVRSAQFGVPVSSAMPGTPRAARTRTMCAAGRGNAPTGA